MILEFHGTAVEIQYPFLSTNFLTVCKMVSRKNWACFCNLFKELLKLRIFLLSNTWTWLFFFREMKLVFVHKRFCFYLSNTVEPRLLHTPST